MGEYSRDDIVIELHIGTGNVDPSLLVESLEILEGALHASDRHDVERAGSRLELPGFVRDASLERIRSYRHQRIHFREAATGSIVLIGAVAAVALFVLEKTIGEAFADGFKESRVYQELRTFFRDQIDRKALFIAEGIRRGFGVRRRTVSVQVLSSQTRAQRRRIVVEIQPVDLPIEPTSPRSLGDALDQERP